MYKQEFNDMFNKDENYHRVLDHCHYTGKHRGATHKICNSSYKTPEQITVDFHNASNHNFHFIIKKLTEEVKGKFECLGENIEKYMIFSLPTQKQNGNVKTMTYKIKFIKSVRFMASLLPSLVDNLAARLHKGKCGNCKSSLDYAKVKGNTPTLKCLDFIKDYKIEFYKGLTKRFQNTHRYFDGDINKFYLMLWKGVYPYE